MLQCWPVAAILLGERLTASVAVGAMFVIIAIVTVPIAQAAAAKSRSMA